VTKIINEIDELKEEIDEIEKWLLKHAESLEGHVRDALKNGKIKQDDFDQMILVVKRNFDEGVPITRKDRQELAFAFAYVQVSAEEIRQGVEHGHLAFSIQAVGRGNMGLGIVEQLRVNTIRLSRKAKNAARTRHSKTDVNKQIVWNYYQQELHTFKSYDHAAEKISYKKDVPFAFRTVRKWITEFHKRQKELPSA